MVSLSRMHDVRVVAVVFGPDDAVPFLVRKAIGMIGGFVAAEVMAATGFRLFPHTRRRRPSGYPPTQPLRI